VQDHAGRVDDAPQPRRGRRAQSGLDRGKPVSAVGVAITFEIDLRTNGIDYEIAAKRPQELRVGGLVDQ